MDDCSRIRALFSPLVFRGFVEFSIFAGFMTHQQSISTFCSLWDDVYLMLQVDIAQLAV